VRSLLSSIKEAKYSGARERLVLRYLPGRFVFYLISLYQLRGHNFERERQENDRDRLVRKKRRGRKFHLSFKVIQAGRPRKWYLPSAFGVVSENSMTCISTTTITPFYISFPNVTSPESQSPLVSMSVVQICGAVIYTRC
jgi:hypothetical protein